MNNNYLTVVRGERNPDDLREDLLQFVTGQRQSNDLSDLKDVLGASGDFRFGSQNFFEVNREVNLVGFGFLGPRSLSSANFMVEVYLRLEETQDVLGLIVEPIVAFKEQIFEVKFPTPVSIQPGVQYQIDFKLDGPFTDILNPSTIKTLVQLRDPICGDEITFKFQRGSNQMVEMYFFT